MKGNNKLLTIAIPCYNSESYLQRALKSTLIGDNRIEVLIVDDGSKSDTETFSASINTFVLLILSL